MISAQEITELMNKQGPSVHCVILRANGGIEEQIFDMSPKSNAMVNFFTAQPTIIGQFPSIDAVLLKKLERNMETDLKNTHKLPHPLHEEEHFGDLLLVRMNSESEPEEFRKTDWIEFLKTAPFTQEAYEEWKLKNNIGEDDEEEEEEDGDDEDMNSPAVLNLIIKNFKEEYGREPNEEEIEEIKDNFRDELQQDEEETELTPEEVIQYEGVIEKLTSKLKREPTEEEILKGLEKFPEILYKIQQTMEDEEQEESDILTKEEGEVLKTVMDLLKEKLGEEPTEEQVKQELLKHENGEEIFSKLNFALDNDQEEEEEEEEMTQEELDLMESVQKELEKKLKRQPELEEIIEALSKKKKGGKELALKLMDSIIGDEEEEEDDDDDDAEEEEEEEEEEEKVVETKSKRQKRSR